MNDDLDIFGPMISNPLPAAAVSPAQVKFIWPYVCLNLCVGALSFFPGVVLMEIQREGMCLFAAGDSSQNDYIFLTSSGFPALGYRIKRDI